MPKLKKRSKFRIEVVKSKRGKQKFFWRIISCNGNKCATSGEKFYRELSPRKTIDSIVAAIKNDEFRIVEGTVLE